MVQLLCLLAFTTFLSADAIHASGTHEIENDENYYSLSLAKYEFMMNAKSVAEQEYEAKTKILLDEELFECGEAIEEYQSERAELLKRKAALNQAHERANCASELGEVIAKLQEYNENLQAGIEDHESPITTSPNLLEPLITGDRVDEEYTGSVLVLSETNRDLLERLVMGESGNQGYIGAALVAQTIHDTMILDNCYDVMTIKKSHAYSGKLDNEPNEDVKRACAFIFDEGGMAVQHKLVYFYAPSVVDSTFHESQKFVVQYKGHRFFDRWD